MLNNTTSCTVQKYEEWAAYIRKKMASSDSSVWYAVLDPHADPDLPEVLWDCDDDPDVWPLLMTSMDHKVRMQGPLFVRLHKKSPMVDWFFTKSQNQPLGLLYELKPKKVDALFEHLQNMLECTLPNGKIGVFRFYDPRILYAILQPETTRLSLFPVGPAIATYAWEPGRETALQLSEMENYIEIQPGFPIEQSHLDAIAAYTTPYAVLDSMHEHCGEGTLFQTLPENSRFINDVCEDLAALGISDMQCLVSGAYIAFRVERNIFSEDLTHEIVKMKKKDESFIDVLEKIEREYIHGDVFST